MAKKTSFDAFVKVFLYGALGVFTGILIGFVFASLIHVLTFTVGSGATDFPELAFTTYLGMGVGAVIGGVFGGVIGNSK